MVLTGRTVKRMEMNIDTLHRTKVDMRIGILQLLPLFWVVLVTWNQKYCNSIQGVTI